MAEGVFQHLVEERGLQSQISWDSAGTSGFHLGEEADERMRATAKAHGITLTHRSRKLVIEDYAAFDYILSMDDANLDIILALQKKAVQAGITASPKILMMRSFDPDAGEDSDVPDPYYGGLNGFEEVYHILARANEHFLEFLREHELKGA